MKRKFKITAVGYGGEYAICTKDVDFVDEWQNEEELDLIEEVQDTFYEDADLEHGFGILLSLFMKLKMGTKRRLKMT